MANDVALPKTKVQSGSVEELKKEMLEKVKQEAQFKLAPIAEETGDVVMKGREVLKGASHHYCYLSTLLSLL